MTARVRSTVHLDPAALRKAEELARREGVSLSEAVNRLVLRAVEPGASRAPYRLRPRRAGFGFDIARAKELAGSLAAERVLAKLRRG